MFFNKVMDLSELIKLNEQNEKQNHIINIVRKNLKNYVMTHNRGEILNLANDIRLCNALTNVEKNNAIKIIYSKASVR